MIEVSAAIRDDVSSRFVRLPLAGTRITAERCAWRPEPAPGERAASERPRRISRGVLPDAIELDGEAGPAAALVSRYRLIQAQIVAELLERKLWGPLGFTRLSDYAAERLGVSGRSLEEDARVVTALASLPLIQQAFEAGVIRWTHARTLAGVATAETERGWLRVALTSTTRALAELAKTARRGDRAPGDAAGPGDAGAPGDAAAPGDAGAGGAAASPDACASRRGASDEGTGPNACASSSGVSDERTGPNACASGTGSDRDGPAAAASTGAASADATASASASATASADATASATASADATASATASSGSEEPLVCFRIVMTRFGRQLWRAVRELASRMCGADVPPARVIETVAAEALSWPHCDPPGSQPQPAKHPRRSEEILVRAFE
ncbi:MAG TPA: hypothetical protein VEC57_07355, partial [Candidatus Limnocylindrales bacterium]|nr:hypothetical protein [Candidatus Limnocylindrales bacterium]